MLVARFLVAAIAVAAPAFDSVFRLSLETWLVVASQELPVAKMYPTKVVLGLPSIYAPDQFDKSPKFVCVYVAWTSLLTFLHELPPRYPQQV